MMRNDTASGSSVSVDAPLGFDYRRSHIDPGRGIYYDNLYRPGSALSFYWENFERPYLEQQFRRVRTQHADQRYLDFACGTGRVLEVGARFFPATVGVDVSDEMLKQARAKVPHATILRSDVLSEDVDLGKFDVVTLFRFLLRAGQIREDVLRWLRGAINDDGTLIVNNHRNALSHRGLSYRLQTALWPNGFEEELLTDRQVDELLRRCGFRVVERYGFQGIPSWRNHLLVDRSGLLPLERRWSASRLARFSKNRIYVCRPA
jgi:SAM-dependent methyltransferase